MYNVSPEHIRVDFSRVKSEHSLHLIVLRKRKANVLEQRWCGREWTGKRKIVRTVAFLITVDHRERYPYLNLSHSERSLNGPNSREFTALGAMGLSQRLVLGIDNADILNTSLLKFIQDKRMFHVVINAV